MRLALLSDIHANFHALSAVATSPQFALAEKLCFSGDAVGYYYDAAAVLDFLRTHAAWSVAGNHDRILTCASRDNRPIDEGYTNRYGRSLAYARDTLPPGSINWLAALPEKCEFTVDGFRVLLCHGSPFDPDEYIYPDCTVEKKEAMFALGFDCIVLGHSHYQFVFERGSQRIVNPGSVGQPRDRCGAAAWALIDTQAGESCVQLMRTPYDVSELERTARANDPGLPYLHTVLRRA